MQDKTNMKRWKDEVISDEVRNEKSELSLDLNDAHFGVEVLLERGRVGEFDEWSDGHDFGVEVLDGELFGRLILVDWLFGGFAFLLGHSVRLWMLIVVVGLFPAAWTHRTNIELN